MLLSVTPSTVSSDFCRKASPAGLWHQGASSRRRGELLTTPTGDALPARLSRSYMTAGPMRLPNWDPWPAALILSLGLLRQWRKMLPCQSPPIQNMISQEVLVAKSVGHRRSTTIEQFAEDLDRVLGRARAKAEGWLGERRSISKHLEAIRETASGLLAQLASHGPAAGAGRRTGGPAGSAGARAAHRGPGRPAGSARRKRTISPEGRARIAAAQKARWAKISSAKAGAAERGAGRPAGSRRKKRTISPEGRARIAAAQKARWAKVRGAKAGAAEHRSGRPAGSGKKKRTISAEGRARIAAAQKARWAKVRAGKKK
jgi:hypothetical protein